MITPEIMLDPGFTPRRVDLPLVLDWMLGDDSDVAERAERALIRAGVSAAVPARERLASASPEQQPSLLRLLGRLGRDSQDESLRQLMLETLSHPLPRAQRVAIQALGKWAHPEHGARLFEQRESVTGPELRALVEALGKLGYAPAQAWLSALQPEDESTRRVVERARLTMGRDVARAEGGGAVDLSRSIEEPCLVALTCRHGLAASVLEDLGPRDGLAVDAPDRLLWRDFTGPLSVAFESRLVLEPALVVPVEPGTDEDLPARWAESLTQPRLLAALERLTEGRPRIRLELASEGHRRALLWGTSEAVSRRTERLVIDPTSASWVARLWPGTRHPFCALVPQRFEDPRFTYRRCDVPAASHPTVAAALARALGVCDDDVIWDPFVGSGLELIERARLGPYRQLIGSDIDTRALSAARENAAAAGVQRLTLERWDARTAAPARVTAIVTNPPLGARLVRDGTLGELLDAFLLRAKQVLMESGRLVWLSPMPERTAQTARQLGFSIERRGAIDVGGLRPELQLMRVQPRRVVAR